MYGKIRFRGKFLATDIATVGLITRVQALVCSEIRPVGKPSATDEASKGLLNGVNVLVQAEIYLASKVLAVNGAGMPRVACVHYLMLRHSADALKATPTHITLIPAASTSFSFSWRRFCTLLNSSFVAVQVICSF